MDRNGADRAEVEGGSALGAGQLALQGNDRINMVQLDNGAHRTVLVGDPWNTSDVFLNERSLIIVIWADPNTNKHVSVRVKLSDVLALPAD